MDTSRWSRWITIAAVLLLAMIAAVVSYSHMYELALRHGEPAWRAALFPLSVDGIVVAASMALLSDARQGRRGGLLPWTLLVLGSLASLAANVAVADPTMWSRVIHAWPAFALIGSYELLMRQFRASASIVRPAHASSTPGEGSDAATVRETRSTITMDEPQRNADHWGQRHLRVVGDAPTPRATPAGQNTRGDPDPPLVQCRAWNWALQHQRADGTLPSGKEIAWAFDRRERWGRMVKQRGKAGALERHHRAEERGEGNVPSEEGEALVAVGASP
ncbi:uncharacterized protein DUF2637 [Haloactinospora alba]|uniref:Uncharacterized protein DUF2637 n=1 Tax=Haloactinospora alba TaxID=405555 RepID=A0A543NEJ3_9ACTN|nr:DUF2637 domain-containing protein [Haloactinospora alba]TQN30264.1 uncharacterized protein DUF2637 [Haloactinospora alba]